MIALSNPRTGHRISVDDKSAEFWRAAGYRDDAEPAKATKAPAKKSASGKSKK